MEFHAFEDILPDCRDGMEMQKVTIAIILTCMIPGGVQASDKPVIGPAPDWVKPISVPTASKDDGAAVRVLLSDQQLSLEAGRQTLYSAVAFRIQTPQGLAAGNISLAWRPETDVLTVHRLLIRRGDQVIDVLASGQTFTVVRREQNLETATLDGVLTANIQPEGLQVGDVVEVADSVTSSDPVLKGHVEQIAGAWNGFPIDRAHLRARWPKTTPVRFRAAGSLPALRPVESGGVTSVDLSVDNVEPIIPPRYAPPRYQLGRLVEMTDFGSWADLSALMAPLYQKAAMLPAQGPLREELGRIRGLSADPKTQAEAALALVQNRIRYVALAMGDGGLVPADAETTWSRRYGDCKGKTALLLAFLHELKIQADPVLVSTAFGDGLDQRLPLVALFNHVLVRATIAGRTYWLDGTRTGDTKLDRLTTPAFGWGLPVASGGGALVRMLPGPLETPNQSVSIHIDATGGLTAPAPTKVEAILRGDEAISVNSSLANLAGEARDHALREYWKGQYDFITIRSTGASFDPETGEQRLTMEGEAKMDWSNGAYETDGTAVGYRADFSRDPGPDRDAPFAVAYPYFTRMQETILLPRGHGDFKLGTELDVDQTIAGIEYRRHATITGNIFTIEKSERSIAPEFAAKDAPAAQAALRTLADHAAKLRQPVGYVATDSEIAAARAETPATADEYSKRAALFVARGMRKEALLDYGKAIELDPNDVWARSNRAVVRVAEGDITGAKADLDKAEALDPTHAENFIGRGLLADVEHRPKDAIEAYTQALQHEPDSNYALTRRAAAYDAVGDHEHAFADRVAAADAGIKANPGAASAYIDRGNLMLDNNRPDEAIKDLDRAVALEPKNALALADRGLARAWKRDLDAATKDLDTAYAIDPKNAVVFRARGLIAQERGAWREAIDAYTVALQIAPKSAFALSHRAEAAQALGDNDAALRDAAAAASQAPTWIEPYLLRAGILRSQGKQDEALAELAAMTAANPNNSYAEVAAANMYSALHKDAEAMRAYDRAIAIKPAAYVYLNRSLHRPKADLAARRADLDAALQLDPKFTAAIAEKARIQADTGDIPGAITTYSAALETSPDDITLLVGRGIAYARSGDAARAEKDFAAARARASAPAILNNMCWSKAIAGVALDSALTDCNAALAKAPDADNILDSRGLVLLRLGRLDDAIADYDRVLSKSPNKPSSLFGRAVAWARKGDRTRSEADAATAVKIDPDVRADFEGYGVRL